MNKKDILSILLIISFILNLYFISVQYFLINSRTNEYKEYIYKDELLRERELENSQVQSEKRHIGSAVLYDKDNNETMLKDIIKGNCLVYRFSSNSCFACVKTDLELLKKISNIIGKEHLLIITKYSNYREYRAFINRTSLDLNCFNSMSGLNLKIEDDINSIPFYFIINNELKAEFIHARKENDSIKNAYFSTILKYLN